MAISWSSWDYSSSNGMRVGMEISAEAIGHTETVCTFTIKVYTQNQYWYDDPQVIEYGYDLSGSTSYTNDEGSGDVKLRATKTVNYSYPASSYGSSPGSIHVSARVTNTYNDVEPRYETTRAVPARPYAAPAPLTSVTATRNSETSATVNWTRHATTGEPYSNITVQRRTYNNGVWGAFSTIATISGSATSYTDNSVVTNRVFNYQVRANNSVGSSAYAGISSTYVFMTPGAPSNVVAAMAGTGTSILVTWKRNDYAASGMRYNVQRSVAGAAYTTVGALVNALSYTDSTPGAGTNQYRVQAVSTEATPDMLSGYTTSNLVSTVTPPLAPSNLSPNGVPADFSNAVMLTWKHNPGGDQVDQTSAEVYYSNTGGSTWILLTTVADNSQSYLIPAGTLPNGINYQWRVRTRGVVSAGYGPYSSPVATTNGRDQPTVTLDPLNPPPSLGTYPLTVGWTFSQGQGDLQATWTAELYNDAGTLIETQTVNDAGILATFASPLENGKSYLVRVRAKSTLGQWTEWASVTTTVSLLPPAEVITEIEAFSCTGTVSLIMIPEDPVVDVSVPVDYVDVQRSINGGEWVTIMTHIEVPTAVLDLTPPTIGTVEYRLVVTSITPSQAIGPVFTLAGEDLCDPDSGQWVFLNYGTDFSQVLRFHGDPAIGSSSGRVRAAQAFLGKPKPALLLGENSSYVITASGALHFGECCYEVDPATDCLHDTPVIDWELAGQYAGVVLYRDWTGRRVFGMLGDVAITNPRPDYGTVGFSVTEVDYTERIWTGELPPVVSPFSNVYCAGSFEDGYPGTSGGSATTVVDTSWFSQGLQSIKTTPNGVSNASSAYVQGFGTNIGDSMRAFNMEKGKTYTISVDCRLTAVQTGTLDPNARKITIGERRGGASTFLAGNVSVAAPNAIGVYRISMIYTVPSDAALQDVVIRLVNGSSVIAQPIWWDALMIEEGETEGLWSEGCIFPPTNLFALNPNFEDPYGGTAQMATVGRSSAWASQGAYSISITPTNTGVTSMAMPAGPDSSTGASLARLGNLKKGQTYTISADAYMPTTQTGTPEAFARMLRMVTRNVGGALVSLATSSALPNIAGSQQRLRVTFTVPTSCEDIQVRLMNGSTNPSEVFYWDALMVEEGVTDGEWTEGIKGALP